MLVLDFSTKYYQDLGTPHQNLQFNVLQLAAKFHEVLIVVSLSAIAVNYVQHKLLEGDGITLGSVLAGFQVSALTSILSLDLWKGAFSERFKVRRPRFAFSITALALLAAVVGPSSNILILPSLGWWNLSQTQGLSSSHMRQSQNFGQLISPETSFGLTVVWTYSSIYQKIIVLKGGFSQFLAQAAQIGHIAPAWNFTMLPSRSSGHRKIVDGYSMTSSWLEWRRPSYYIIHTTSNLVDNMLPAMTSTTLLSLRSFEFLLSNGGLPLGLEVVAVCNTSDIQFQEGPTKAQFTISSSRR